MLLLLPKQTKDKSTRKFKLTKIMHEHYQKETAREWERGRQRKHSLRMTNINFVKGSRAGCREGGGIVNGTRTDLACLEQQAATANNVIHI